MMKKSRQEDQEGRGMHKHTVPLADLRIVLRTMLYAKSMEEVQFTCQITTSSTVFGRNVS